MNYEQIFIKKYKNFIEETDYLERKEIFQKLLEEMKKFLVNAQQEELVSERNLTELESKNIATLLKSTTVTIPTETTTYKNLEYREENEFLKFNLIKKQQKEIEETYITEVNQGFLSGRIFYQKYYKDNIRRIDKYTHLIEQIVKEIGTHKKDLDCIITTKILFEIIVERYQKEQAMAACQKLEIDKSVREHQIPENIEEDYFTEVAKFVYTKYNEFPEFYLEYSLLDENLKR